MIDYPHLDELVTSVTSWSVDIQLRESLNSPGMSAEYALLNSTGREAAAAAAVVVDGRVWAELYVSRDRAPGFSADDVILLRLLASSIGLMRSAYSLALSAEAGGKDALTGLSLRPAIDQAINGAPSGAGVIVAAFDIDGLERINDEFGHAAGDRLIVTAADALRTHVGALPGATVVRWGGDEFVAAVVATDVDIVVEACAEAQRVVRSALPRTDLSCGVASDRDLRGPLGSGRPLLRLADATLYRAKRSGLNVPLRSWSGQVHWGGVRG